MKLVPEGLGIAQEDVYPNSSFRLYDAALSRATVLGPVYLILLVPWATPREGMGA